jgi:hypothetical protein
MDPRRERRRDDRVDRDGPIARDGPATEHQIRSSRSIKAMKRAPVLMQEARASLK